MQLCLFSFKRWLYKIRQEFSRMTRDIPKSKPSKNALEIFIFPNGMVAVCKGENRSQACKEEGQKRGKY